MARKVYVSVVVRINEAGEVRPLSIEFEDGCIYEVDRLIACKRAASRQVGGGGMRYTCRIRGRETYLFEDENRWFVEAKDA